MKSPRGPPQGSAVSPSTKDSPKRHSPAASWGYSPEWGYPQGCLHSAVTVTEGNSRSSWRQHAPQLHHDAQQAIRTATAFPASWCAELEILSLSRKHCLVLSLFHKERIFLCSNGRHPGSIHCTMGFPPQALYHLSPPRGRTDSVIIMVTIIIQ